MSTQWYYLHDGARRGPFSEEEIKEHAIRKMLLENDLLWRSTKEPVDAVPAAAALDFTQLRVAGWPAPDWVADIAALESRGPVPGLLPTDEIPEWLDDLRLWFGLELYTAAQRAGGQVGSTATRTGAIPDWLESWMTPQGPRVAQLDQTPPAPTASAMLAVTPVVLGSGEKPAAVAGPVQPSLSSSVSVTSQAVPPITPQPAISLLPVVSMGATPTTRPKPLAKSQISAPASLPAVTPPVRICPSPVETAAGAGSPSSSRQTLLQASGIDLETGRIVDQEKFHKWKRQHAQPPSAGAPAVSNASLFEAFRNARTAVYRWVDDDANHACIMQADPEEIQRKPEIRLILDEYASYGKGMQEKLLRHLEHLVENRRKYYQAVEKRRRAAPGL